MDEGIVYVLKNPAFPNLIKIGITTRNEVQIRMSELYTTGVPLPFECAFAGKVENPKLIETALHHAFSNNRINPSREFFEIEDTQAIAVLKLMVSEDVTPELKQELDKVDTISKEAGKKYSNRRPNQNFVEMGIPIGAALMTADANHICTVVDEKKVEFDGEIMSLTKLTRIIKNLEYNIQPAPHWYYNGRSIKEIYDEIYES